MSPTDRLALGIIAAIERFHTIARPRDDWTPTAADLMSVLDAFVKAANEAVR